MKKRLLVGLSVLTLGVVLSACEPEVEVEEDVYVPGAGYEFVLSPLVSLNS